jgi:hypothetical protein
MPIKVGWVKLTANDLYTLYIKEGHYKCMDKARMGEIVKTMILTNTLVGDKNETTKEKRNRCLEVVSWCKE